MSESCIANVRSQPTKSITRCKECLKDLSIDRLSRVCEECSGERRGRRSEVSRERMLNSPRPQSVKLKSCKRCGVGDVLSERDAYGRYTACLQCGNVEYEK
jgi:ribosomal protein S27AE